MKSIIVSNLNKSIGIKEIFSGAGFQINPGEKYGLIGPNGCGKTTLLNILCGQDKDFSGDIHGAAGTMIGYVKQNIGFTQNLTVKAAVLKDYENLINDLRAAESLLADPGSKDMDRVLLDYQKARDAYDKAGVDYVVSRMRGLLDTLGLPGKLEQKLKTLSGGEKNLVALACALIKKPDLLILDEPDNHLDFAGLSWFEQFLANYKKTIIIVSHKRYLLDRVCSVILEIEERKIYTFKGNYSNYRMEKLKKQTSEQADYAAVSRRLARLANLVKRFQDIARRTADPAWGKRLRARKTQLKRENEQAVENPLTQTKRIRIELNAENSKAAIALRLKDYSRAFGKNQLFRDVNLEILCGEKVGLIGANGSGKTTLLKDIVRYGEWENPGIQIGPSLKVGYMAQQQEIFDRESTIVEEIRSLGPLSPEDVFKIVSKFLFTWHDMDKKIGDLSGGEINRLQLARLMYLQPTFLILDEPTNHLDIPSREVVENALCDFKGTVFVVSHDRYFLEKVVAKVVDVKDQKLLGYNGSFSEFWFENFSVQKKSKGKIATRGAERKKRSRQRRLYNVKSENRIMELEKQITDEEAKKAVLERQITDAFRGKDHQQGRKLSAALKRLIGRIDKLYAEWEQLE